MRLNKKKLSDLNQMLGSALSWHMIFWMQDGQDLDPGFKRREIQRRARWKKAAAYFNKMVTELEKKK